MKSPLSFCESIRSTGERDAAPNARGNTIYRIGHSTSRYLIDFATDFTSERWQQFDTDQDAAYFGVWLNPSANIVLTYCEGDWILVDCPTDAAYNAEVASAIEFYGEGQIATVIDGSGATTYRQDRSRFLKPAR